MTTIMVGTIPASVRARLLRPVRRPEEAQLLAAVNNRSRQAGRSLLVSSVDMSHTDYAHHVNSDLAADGRLADADGRPLAYVRATTMRAGA